MEMSHGVTMLVRRADNVAKVSCVLKGCSRLLATDPLGKEIGWVLDVRNVAHLDLPTLEALQEGQVAAKAVTGAGGQSKTGSDKSDPMFSTMQNVRPNLAKESWRASSQHLPCRCRKGGSNLTMQPMVGSVALDHTSHRSRIQSAIG